jgi:signal transduction histidine kinase
VSGSRVPLAWTLFGLTALLAVGQVVVLVSAEAALFSAENLDDGFPLVTIATVVASAVGLLIVSRYPRHRVGWLFLIGQVGTIVGLLTQSVAFVAMTEGLTSRTAGQWTLWVSLQFGGVFALTLVALLLLVAPDGKLLSPRWRWAVAVVLVGIVVHNGAVVLGVDPADLTAEANAPGTSSVVPLLTLSGGVLLVIGLACGAVCLFKRLRASSGPERAQLRWIAAAATALALSLPMGTLLDLLLDVPPWVAVTPLMAAYLALPICTGVAILRWRLYDIDLILNRSSVMALLSGFVALGYVAVVVALAELAHDKAAWPSLVATVLVALAFQPARRRASQLADRLVYGEQAAPYEALAAFTDELKHSSSLADLLPRTAEAAGRVTGAERARVWVELPGHPPTTAEWSDTAGRGGPTQEELVPVVEGGEQLGGLVMTMPPGRQLRRTESRLLHDVAAQLGAAFRGVQLERELAERVRLLDIQRQQLAQSQARLRSTQVRERRRFEAAIAEQVLPFIAPLADRLRELEKTSTATGRWPEAEVDQLVRNANQGLEALRALTRRVFPAQLTRRGLVSTLSTHLVQANAGHTLDVDFDPTARFRPEVESTAYFCAVELLRHFGQAVRVSLAANDKELVLTVTGSNTGRAKDGARHLLDRVEGLGGTISLVQEREHTLATVRLPLAASAPAVEEIEQPVGAEVRLPKIASGSAL